jgi:chemotaxis protein methyltransferase WspC
MNLAPVLDLLQERTGLAPATLGVQAVEAAVAARLRAVGLADPAAYAARLAADPAELAALVDEVVVPETWFLRGGAVFAHLAACARAGLPGGVFRALSVPCSTGEEPYSLALALAEVGLPPDRFHIDGIDISPRAVLQARKGVFSELSFRQTPPEVRRRHFRPTPAGWEIDPALRAAVHFRVGNLLDPAFLRGVRPYQLVFCRNLFIYLHPAARQQALDALHRLLAPEGLLCVGHAEPLDPDDDRFERVGPADLFLYRSVPPRPRHGPAGRSSASPEAAKGPPAPATFLSAPGPAPKIREAGPGEGLLARARRVADAGRLAEALALIRSAEDQAGPSAELCSLTGVIHQARHDLAAAVHSFRQALYLEPDHPEALVHLMLLHEQQGDAGQAAALRTRLGRLAERTGGAL